MHNILFAHKLLQTYHTQSYSMYGSCRLQQSDHELTTGGISVHIECVLHVTITKNTTCCCEQNGICMSHATGNTMISEAMFHQNMHKAALSPKVW